MIGHPERSDGALEKAEILRVVHPELVEGLRMTIPQVEETSEV